MDSFADLAARAERRHGLLTVDDLLHAGVGKRDIERWARSGRLVSIARGVYRVGGAPLTPHGRVLGAIAVHEHDTWASHRTAAWLWGLPGFASPGRVEVIRRLRQSSQRSGVLVHRSTRVPEHHVTVRDAIPVTTLPRTLFDLASCMRPDRLDRAVEAGLRTRWCTIGALHRVLVDLGGRGRPGSAAMREVLDRRGSQYVPTESELDLLGRAVLDGIGGLEWQVEFSDEQGYIRRVDGFHPGARLVIEWDGAAFHQTPWQVELDRVGDARLRRLGLGLLRFGWFDVTKRPDLVRASVEERIALGVAA